MLPLEKIRVIDFGTALAAPVLCRMLADMGAEVIKVENKDNLDGIRLGKPIIGDDVAGGDKGKWPNLQPAFHNYNRNKRGITLDLKDPQGIDLLKRLLKVSDVVCDNFRPGLLADLGLGYEVLSGIKPGIISICLTGVGESGPWTNLPTYAHSITAMGGINSLIGYRDELIGTMTNAYGDANAAVHGCFAVLSALYYRQRTGKGQHIDLSECEATTSLLAEPILEYGLNGRVFGPVGNDDPDFVPHNNYKCSGEDKWVAIAVKSEEEWKNFCEAIDQKEWIQDDRFSDKYRRFEHKKDLDILVTEWTIKYSPYEVMEILQKAGVAAVPVMNIEDEYMDPHLRERQTFVEFDHPLVGFEVLYGIPWKLSKTPGAVYRHAPSLGEDNHYVFGQLLGLSDEEIARLEEEKVIN
jgi:benzylsuccinate CoA-transferase BbsF subunit